VTLIHPLGSVPSVPSVPVVSLFFHLSRDGWDAWDTLQGMEAIKGMNIFELLDGPISPPELVAVIREPPPEVIGRLMSESEIIELWEERASIIHEANNELVQWCQSQGFTPEKTWRHCELLAASDMSMNYGTYVEAVIRPLIEAH
jgi:hypothetical protein